MEVQKQTVVCFWTSMPTAHTNWAEAETRLLSQSALGQLPVGPLCLPQNFLCFFSCQALLSPTGEFAQFFVLLVRTHW